MSIYEILTRQFIFKKCATYQTEYVFKTNSFFGMFLYMHRKLNICIKNVEIL